MRAITVRAVLSDVRCVRRQPARCGAAGDEIPRPLQPPAADLEVVERIELRINNILLPPPTVQDGWLVFEAQPAFLAHGENLVGVWVNPPDAAAERLTLEKLEIHVGYR